MRYNIDQWLEFKDMMIRIASEYHKKYPMVDVDDFQQEMYLWFVTHPKKFKEWIAMDEKDSSKLIARSLRNQCLKYGEKEKARMAGYATSDVHYYDPVIVEAFLPTIIAESYEMPAKLKDLSGIRTNSDINDGMNWLAMRSDVAKGYYKLPPAKQFILRVRYSDEDAEWTKVAEELGTTPDGARMKVQRTLLSLIQNIGGKRPYHDEDNIEETTDASEESGE
jgi:hypothetical protein